MKYSFNKDKILTIGILPVMWLIYFLFEVFSGRVNDLYTLVLNLCLTLVFALTGWIIYKCNTKNPNGLNTKILLPTFSEYEEAILSVNGEIKYYKLKEKNNFEIDNEFIDNIKDDIDVVFICNPNNPTGVLTTNQFIIKVLKKALITNTIIVIDESFLDFMEINNEYSSKGLLNYYDNLIVVKSLTKFFAIPGARIGYGLCKNNVLINEINKVTVPWSINIIAADAIIQGLKEKDYINNSIKYVKDEKEYLYGALKEIQVLKVLKPSVNFIMFKLLIDLDLKGELIKRKILIRSCSNYIGLNENFYRIAVRTSEENKIIINEIRNILFDK